MEKDNFKTKVVFRKWPEGDILALFPEIDEGNYKCSSYMHIGQHSGADYTGCIQSTKAAIPEEYADLKRELEGLGYDLDVKRKYIAKRRSKYGN